MRELAKQTTYGTYVNTCPTCVDAKTTEMSTIKKPFVETWFVASCRLPNQKVKAITRKVRLHSSQRCMRDGGMDRPLRDRVEEVRDEAGTVRVSHRHIEARRVRVHAVFLAGERCDGADRGRSLARDLGRNLVRLLVLDVLENDDLEPYDSSLTYSSAEHSVSEGRHTAMVKG